MILLQMAPRSSVVVSEHYFNTTVLPQRITANAAGIGNPLDTLCATLEKKMQFEEGERDLVMLQVSSPAHQNMSHFVSQ
jgi:hypothetical protein